MDSAKIAVLSDTHGLLRDSFIEELKSCDFIIHAGDIGSEQCYNRLKELGIHLYMIKGNCDMGSYAAFLPESLSFRICDIYFHLIHNRSKLPNKLPESDIILYGHTHRYAVFEWKDKLFINPGYAGNVRPDGSPSMVIIQIQKGSAPLEINPSETNTHKKLSIQPDCGNPEHYSYKLKNGELTIKKFTV